MEDELPLPACMPFGLQGSSSVLMLVMNTAMTCGLGANAAEAVTEPPEGVLDVPGAYGPLHRSVAVYMDCLLCYSPSLEQHLRTHGMSWPSCCRRSSSSRPPSAPSEARSMSWDLWVIKSWELACCLTLDNRACPGQFVTFIQCCSLSFTGCHVLSLLSLSFTFVRQVTLPSPVAALCMCRATRGCLPLTSGQTLVRLF